MSLWIDVTTVASCGPPATGIPRVELNLARHLLAAGEGVRTCLYESRLGRFSEVTRDQFELIDERYRTGVTSDGLFRLAIQRRDLRAHGGMDVFSRGDIVVACGLNWRPEMGNMGRLYAMRSGIGLRVITLCYDIIPVKFPHLVPGMDSVFAPYLREMGRHADHVACISRCTRDDFAQWLTAMGERVPDTSVLPLGCATLPLHNATPSARIDPILGKRFLLCVATVESRKNQQVLFDAYARLVDAGVADLPLLAIVGGIGHGGQAFIDNAARDPRLVDKVAVLSGLSDVELAFLYRHCLFTLYPSLYEGWGLPVSESLAYGKFCLASNRGALAEAGLDLADYADPDDVGAWARKIEHYLTTPGALAERESVIARRYEAPSWRASAQHLLAIAAGLAAE